jgi:N-acetylglutamate synthase-like GNAT family acetyltransferase
VSKHPVQLLAHPLAVWERDGLAAALGGSGLSTEGVSDEVALFWRFTSQNDVPIGFGGLEVHGRDALLRSLVTLPPVRRRGLGGEMVTLLEMEAVMRGCGAVWVLAAGLQAFFARLGYAVCERSAMPESIRRTASFSRLDPDSTDALVKRLD